MAYSFNIGHRLFPRDATEDLPSRRAPLPFSTRRHIVPVSLYRDVPGPVRFLVASIATRSRPCPAGRFLRRRRTTPSRQSATASTRAPDAARSSPANPFLESPADSGTRAPNLQRLRQAGDARQDLVRISERTTKCGDYGDESAGDAEVSRIRGESERELSSPSRFHSPKAPNRSVLTLGRRGERGCRPLACLKQRVPTGHVFVTQPRRFSTDSE